jgi:hypothetical protein
LPCPPLFTSPTRGKRLSVIGNQLIAVFLINAVTAPAQNTPNNRRKNTFLIALHGIQ